MGVQLFDVTRVAMVAWLAAPALFALSQAASEPAPGTLVERITCRDDPSEAYALYLPRAYTTERRWPVVYVLDPRGRALVAAELLKEGAERYGFVIASSYGSRSDEAVDPNVKALGALWRDTRERVALDERRSYGVGFSGTARSLLRMADMVPGSLAGVIACGAGFAPDRAPHAGLGFPIFVAVGETDFNYQEVQRLTETLTTMGVTHRVEIFDGPHTWAPAPLLADALAWLEVRAMRDERRPRDAALASELLARWQQEAAGFEQQGRPIEAERRYAGLARDFEGLADVSAARVAAERIRASGAYQEEQKRRSKWRKREEEYEARAPRALSLLDVNDAPGSLRAALEELRLDELRKRAATATDREERLSAQRSLAEVAVQTGFYVPRALREKGDDARAALVLAVAAEATPENPEAWYGLARARARVGWKKDALEALERAVEAGFSDAARIESDADLAPLHGEAGYRTIVVRLSALKPS
jgi:predicted esterase